MQHLETLNRIRTKFMYNLGIREIAEREVPSFVYKIDLPPIVVQLNREEKALERKNEKMKTTKSTKSFKTVAKKVQAIHSLGPRSSIKTPEHKDMTHSYTNTRPYFSGGTDKISPDPSPAISKSKMRPDATDFDSEEVREKPDPKNFKSYWRAALTVKGCITCGKTNLSVKYHGERHICLECRKKVKTYNGDKVVLFLDDEGNVVCKGIKIIRNTLGEIEKQMPYDADPNKLMIAVENIIYKCYATTSAPDELIVLLSDNQADRGSINLSVDQRKSVMSGRSAGSVRQF